MWDLNNVSVGDYIVVQIVNKNGDRNLDGAIIKGVIEEVISDYQMVRVDSGWCCRTKDLLLNHITREALLKYIQKELIKEK